MKNLVLPFAVFVAGIISALLLPGTGDHGDSVQHFLIAKNSWSNPALFFDHWGKPLFTFFASPFAQLGFKGIKIFNVLLFSGSTALLIEIGKHLRTNGLIAALILLACPMLPSHVLSGLTEPMFAFFLLLSLLLAYKKRWIWAAIVLSFLPFIRSEGWIMLASFVPYFVIKKQIRLLPFLLLGTGLYSITGWGTHGDFLWVFTKTPYVNQGNNYGSGNYFHFANQLFYWCGLISCVLFGFGLLHLLSRWRKVNLNWLLVLVLFFSFFFAHSFFWGSGMFHSMGMARVLICILPLFALIGSRFFSILPTYLNLPQAKTATAVILLLLFTLPLLSRKRLHKFQNSFQLHHSQILINEALEHIPKDHHLGAKTLYCSAPWAKLKWQEKHGLGTTPLISEITTATGLILWDGYFSPLEEGISEANLRNKGFVEIWRGNTSENMRNTVSVWQISEH